MNGKESASTSGGGAESTKVFIESKLKSSLVHVYDATRISNDIKDLEIKYQTLQNFKDQLSKDSNSNPAPALTNMSKKIDDMQRDINQKKEEMKSAETQVVMGFQDIMQFLIGHSQEGLNSTQESLRTALSKFGTSLTSGLETSIADIRRHLIEVDNNKMDASEKAGIFDTIDAFKKHIIELQKSQITAIKTLNEQQCVKLTAHIEQRLQNVNSEALTTQVQKRVVDNLDGKFKQHLQQLEKAQKALPSSQDTDGKVSEKIVQTVRDEVKNYLTPETLKSIISTLPEYQALQSLRPEAAPLPDAVKKIMADLQQEVSDLKAKSFSTRALVNNLVDRNLTPTEVMQAHQAAAVQHVEEMEKSIQLMHNNMKMMEVVLSTRLKQMEENNVAVSASRKRPRVDDDLEMVDQQDENSNREVLRRISEVEAAHQKLLDFILQWKDTVLDDSFPEKLSNAFKKIEEVLLNHQTFIAFLTDPFTTGQAIKAKETASIPQTPSPQTTLHPAMLDAISLLVKQTAEEYSAPLKEKIKALEEKLNAKQQ
ncbi:hypothetical protein FB192DRAFT_1349837 [Mucor lusitanicus]|uniref:Uncharacterized protein n=2 Tax=Mucor circinelloides f. lusitanicus TaxID=29924 RepID=A0A168K3C3_MUCCL|nr:hypothetical protein FB192DRAFT_1349837 [Mucor lusitanicus]OAD01951.1 hypothetical protein MUCCIDRAFT_82331 [Mucor lusitanicus CBS 277.49]